jgi:nitrogen fixation NifU-like protein
MIDALYQKNILRHAAAACRAGKLKGPHATAALQSPLCGDHIVMDVACDGGHITDLAYTARACVLCQASASIIGEQAIGKTAGEIAEVRAALTGMLKNGQPPAGWPAAGWAALEVFAPVAAHTNRHICVTLPFRALEKACEGVPEKT